MDAEEITPVEKQILEKAIEKLNFIYSNGRGESLTDDETLIFNYWRERGKIRSVAPAPYGEIYALVDKSD